MVEEHEQGEVAAQLLLLVGDALEEPPLALRHREIAAGRVHVGLALNSMGVVAQASMRVKVDGQDFLIQCTPVPERK